MAGLSAKNLTPAGQSLAPPAVLLRLPHNLILHKFGDEHGSCRGKSTAHPAASVKASTVNPAERIRLRSVPTATSLWSGTESVAWSPPEPG